MTSYFASEGIGFVAIMLGAVAMWTSLGLLLQRLHSRPRVPAAPRTARTRPVLPEKTTLATTERRTTLWFAICPTTADGDIDAFRVHIDEHGSNVATRCVWQQHRE